MTNSIRVRLVALFTVVTTVTLSLFGLYAQSNLSAELAARFADVQESSLGRLQINLPEPLWNYDTKTVHKILAAEGSIAEIRRIQVFDKANRPVSEIALDDPSRQQSGSAQALIVRERDIVWTEDNGTRDERIGRVVVSFTPERIDQALSAQLRQRILEILVLDAILIVLLTVSLRMVFRPLHQLREALFDLAGKSADDVAELPDGKLIEFSDLVRGFNLSLRRLHRAIEQHTQAEIEAQSALQQLKKTQSDLLRSEKLAAMGSLVAGVAHELNTPIGNAVLAASTINDSAQDFEQLRANELTKSALDKFIASIQAGAQLLLRNLERASGLVSSFKQLSGVKEDTQRISFELHEAVQAVIKEYAPALKSSSYVLINAVPAGVVLTSYPHSLQEVLRVLVSNSLMHAFDGREHGSLRFRCEGEADGFVTLAYVDDGVGMPQAVLNRIFEPFFTTKLGRGRSGLGLHIVHNLVTGLLGGRIDVVSAPGRGCEFRLCIPVIAPDIAEK